MRSDRVWRRIGGYRKFLMNATGRSGLKRRTRPNVVRVPVYEPEIKRSWQRGVGVKRGFEI